VGALAMLCLGDTRGHWEGNTLVLETANFRPDTDSRYTTHLTERFTRVADDRIEYNYTVNDPTQFTKPWSAMVLWNNADGQMYEYACHEGNYDMVHFLSGGRAREGRTGDDLPGAWARREGRLRGSIAAVKWAGLQACEHDDKRRGRRGCSPRPLVLYGRYRAEARGSAVSVSLCAAAFSTAARVNGRLK